MTSNPFLDDCIDRNRVCLNKGLSAASDVPEDRLNRQTVGGEWSPAQVYRHLYLSNLPYEALIQAGLKSVPSDSSNPEIQNTWFGRTLAKMSGPGGNAPVPKSFDPGDGPLPASVVDEWAEQYRRIIGMFEACRGKDLNAKVFRNPMMRLFKMNLADCILVLTVHTERHIAQIEERVHGSC